MPKQLTTEVVRGCFYTRILIGIGVPVAQW